MATRKRIFAAIVAGGFALSGLAACYAALVLWWLVSLTGIAVASRRASATVINEQRINLRCCFAANIHLSLADCIELREIGRAHV